jgi:hypothetical protein
MHQDNRRPFSTLARSRKEAVDDFFAAAVRGMHGDDSFSHVATSRDF